MSSSKQFVIFCTLTILKIACSDHSYVRNSNLFTRFRTYYGQRNQVYGDNYPITGCRRNEIPVPRNIFAKQLEGRYTGLMVIMDSPRSLDTWDGTLEAMDNGDLFFVGTGRGRISKQCETQRFLLRATSNPAKFVLGANNVDRWFIDAKAGRYYVIFGCNEWNAQDLCVDRVVFVRYIRGVTLRRQELRRINRRLRRMCIDPREAFREPAPDCPVEPQVKMAASGLSYAVLKDHMD